MRKTTEVDAAVNEEFEVEDSDGQQEQEFAEAEQQQLTETAGPAGKDKPVKCD
jgi:hypothetical protein